MATGRVRPSPDEFRKRIESEGQSTATVGNEDMTCADCTNAIPGNTTRCKVYDDKPNGVYYNKPCNKYGRRL